MSVLSFDNLNKSVELYVKQKNGRYQLATTEQILATARKKVDDCLCSEALRSPTEVKQFFNHKLSGLSYEVGAVIFLNNQLQFIEYLEMFHGTFNEVNVYPREIVKTALKLNASAVFLAHNHPSGIETPSQGDIKLTQFLKQALQLVEVRLLDHVIVAGNKTTSLAESGLL